MQNIGVVKYKIFWKKDDEKGIIILITSRDLGIKNFMLEFGIF